MVLSSVEWNNHINEDNNNSIKREKRRGHSSDRGHSKCMCFHYLLFLMLMFIIITCLLLPFVFVLTVVAVVRM